MIVTTRWARDVMDALASGVFDAGRNAGAYGEVVWSWRRDAGAKFLRSTLLRGDGDNKPAHRGERDISRKAIAQGMSECFRCPVCSCAPTMHIFGTRDRGCSVHPAFPAPSFRRGANEFAELGRKRAAGTRGHVLLFNAPSPSRRGTRIAGARSRSRPRPWSRTAPTG